MNLVPRRTKVSYSTYGKLPNGAVYYLASGRTGPFVKIADHTRLQTNSIPQVTPPQTAVTDNSVAVIKVDKFVLREQS